jgi:outer membrane protein assembly factor BamD
MRFLLLTLLFAGVACSKAINVNRYPTPAALYQEGLARFEAKKWDDAITAFERLTFDLPSRDPLLPLAHWYLGQARLKNVERLLAAQSFIRIAESYARRRT